MELLYIPKNKYLIVEILSQNYIELASQSLTRNTILKNSRRKNNLDFDISMHGRVHMSHFFSLFSRISRILLPEKKSETKPIRYFHIR